MAECSECMISVSFSVVLSLVLEDSSLRSLKSTFYESVTGVAFQDFISALFSHMVVYAMKLNVNHIM